MRIQHNIMAMNAYRNYNNNTSALSKNLERLSSGYKINRAGDDAAGLAISEKMRAQITGLEAAQKNVKDGTSLVNTAEGAMQEIQDMLNRMVSLATQSSNGTYDNEVDRKNLQAEVDQLRDEINRIADSANFNGIKLLDGSLDTNADLTTTADFTVGKDLPGVGLTLGVDTVLHNKALSDSGTEFSVDLHNFTFKADKGSSLTMTVGDTKIELFAGDNATGAELTGADLISAFTGNAATYGLTLKIDGTNAASLDGMEISGQKFSVSADDTLDYRLNFVQENPPEKAADEVNGAMKVTISGATVGSAAEFNVDFTKIKDADGNAITTLTENSILTIGGSSYTVQAGDTWADVADNLATMGIEGYELESDGAGVLTLKATSEGKKNAPVISYTEVEDKTGATAVAGTKTASGVDGTAASVTGGATPATTLGNNKTFTVNNIVIDPKYTGTAIPATDIKDADGNATGYQYAIDGSGNITITATKAGGASCNGTVSVSVDGADAEDFEFTGGVDGLKESYTYDVTGWNSKLGDIKIGADAIDSDELLAGEEVAVGSTGYVATLDGNTLTLTAENAGALNSDGPTAAAGAAAFSVYKTAVSVDVETVRPGAVGSEIENITQGSNGDWNVSTTNINNVTAGGNNRLASTYFTLTEDMATEGSKLRVGDVTYTFTSDKDKIGQDGYVDISSGDLATIAKNLTAAAADNALYTVGHDGNRITFTETMSHANDLSAGGTYPPDNWDLSDPDKIAESLGFTAGESKKGAALTLQIGDTSDSYNQLKVSVGDMHTKALGIDNIDISTPEGAQAAIDTIKDAINYVSSVRGNLGAISNRLDHTANNLSVMAENITDAESTIRDTDIAEEMMAYTKNNILVQSAQAMLAQANQVPQGVLQLLQ